MITITEWCSNCETEVKLKNGKILGKCPNCGKAIKPCSLCNTDKVDCSKCYLDKHMK